MSATVGATTAGIDMALPEASQGATITGTVTNAATAAAVSGVQVGLYDANNNPVSDQATSKHDGAYTLSGLLPGTYKVQFRPYSGNLAYQFYSGQSSLGTANTVTVGAGQTAPNVNAALTAGGSISGSVTDKASGAGLGDASVVLEDGAGNTLTSTNTQPDGSYVLGGIPSGSGYHVEFDGPTLPGGGFYATQWWNDSLTFGSSNTVGVTAGANTPGISAALTTAAATTTPVQVVTTPAPVPVPKPKPGPPKVSHGKLSGLSHHRATLRFTVTSGAHGAAKLKSIAVTLPRGLSFVRKALATRKAIARDLKVKGGGKFTVKLRRGTLTITLNRTAPQVKVTITFKALKVSRALAAEAKKHKDRTVKVRVQVTNAKHQRTRLTLTFRRPR